MSDPKSSKSESSAPVEKGADTKSEASASADEKKGGSASLVGIVGFLATLAIGFFAGRELDKSYHIGERIRSVFTGGPDTKAEDDSRYKAELRGDEPQLGPDDALVTIIEYSDFQCPYCAKAAPVIKQVIDSYDGDVRVIFKQYPLPNHSKAVPAGKAAYAAHKQGKFWEFHDELFTNKANVSKIDAFAKEQGLDVAQFQKDMASKEVADWIDNDHVTGGKVGASGTPYFLVNGRPFSGARPITHWEAIVEEEIEAANALGVERAKVYETLMKDAKTTRGGGGSVGGAPSARANRPGAPDPSKTYAVQPDGRPQAGPDDALVTIVEYSDFQCPYCEKVVPTINQIKEAYPNDVRVVFRQRPLGMHPQARPAAQAVLAAHRQGKF
ncbi:MAG: DsbA family protein, partial [Nannocystaceae bacterium]